MSVSDCFSTEKHRAHACSSTTLNYDVFIHQNKTIYKNCTWAELRSILSNAIFEGNITTFLFVCKVAGICTFFWRHKWKAIGNDD